MQKRRIEKNKGSKSKDGKKWQFRASNPGASNSLRMSLSASQFWRLVMDRLGDWEIRRFGRFGRLGDSGDSGYVETGNFGKKTTRRKKKEYEKRRKTEKK